MKHKYDISDFVSVPTEQSITYDLVKRFIKRRKEYGLTQKELSIKSDVSYGSIRRFESQGDISLKSLLKLSSAIGCLEDFNELFRYMILKNIKDLK
ncbi:MAG: helix-turn-helix domain-containing protein [Firmicutes bacterium]|nr:helix-turn-helix domain-containing protein [Bacillota bacterium]